MHVAFVTGEYPPMDGGVGAYTRALAQALAAQGVRASVITARAAQQDGAPDGTLGQVLLDTGEGVTDEGPGALALLGKGGNAFCIETHIETSGNRAQRIVLARTAKRRVRHLFQRIEGSRVTAGPQIASIRREGWGSLSGRGESQEARDGRQRTRRPKNSPNTIAVGAGTAAGREMFLRIGVLLMVRAEWRRGLRKV